MHWRRKCSPLFLSGGQDTLEQGWNTCGTRLIPPSYVLTDITHQSQFLSIWARMEPQKPSQHRQPLPIHLNWEDMKHICYSCLRSLPSSDRRQMSDLSVSLVPESGWPNLHLVSRILHWLDLGNQLSLWNAFPGHASGSGWNPGYLIQGGRFI